MARQATELLREISQAAQDVVDYTDGMNSDAFLDLPSKDGKTFRAIKNALAEIGEAVKNLPPEVKEKHPSIDWRGLSGLRDVVAHQYHRLDMEMLGLVVSEELPALIEASESELNCTVIKPK
jgi:uncharacterized protein with HEPN domain